MRASLEALAAALGARLEGAPIGGLPPIEHVSTDSRTLVPGCLFVALRGPSFDGHAFVAAAAAAGARAAVVDEAGAAALRLGAGTGAGAGLPRLVVADTGVALGALGTHARLQRPGPAIAVTGSNGKTSTKELLAAALTGRGPVHRTQGNLNNLVGLPLTLLAWPEPAWAAVLELGMSAPGEIATLTRIARPQVGLVTCVAAAHLEHLGSIAGVAAAKCELFAEMPPGATAVLNADDGPLMHAAAPHVRGRPTLHFGTGPQADVRLLGCAHRLLPSGALGLGLELGHGGERFVGTLQVLGRHQALNAAGAVAAALALGVSPREALAHMAAAQLPGARGRVLTLKRPAVQVLDDSYNANPQSMLAALHTLTDVAGASRRIAVLGDMLELGPTAAALHTELGAQAAALGVAAVVAVGQYAPQVAAGARAAGIAAHVAHDADAAAALVPGLLQAGDWLLVKGSRGNRLERLVQSLTAGAEAHPAAAPQI